MAKQSPPIGAVNRCAIFPPIGVARVGNSPKGYFIGPEVPGQMPRPEDNAFKDRQGRVKREVARFRIYGLDNRGNVVEEITAAEATIEWSVHVANRKGAWYCFDCAMDLPQAKAVARRNPAYGGRRERLVIDPGPKTVVGRNRRTPLDGGEFLGVDVPLGEIRTDSNGNLLVFGGLGRAAPISNKPIDSLDNEEWWDDTSDGPVTARVTLRGRTLQATPAWVVVGPPNFAPGIQDVVTLYDVLLDLAVTEKWIARPERTSFSEHVLPIFRRLCDMQWVNAGINLQLGWGSADHLLGADLLERLASPGSEQGRLRRRFFRRFRRPGKGGTRPFAWPPMYGDGMSWPPDQKAPRKWLTLTRLQYSHLRNWARGDFVADWDPDRSAPAGLESLPLRDRPAALTEAALENCLGGAFHPGCELSWPMRRAQLYDAPFRIRHRPAGAAERDFGKKLSPRVALSPDGPLAASGPGDLTRWMSIPWQADTASCGSGYEPALSPYLPTFWPARSPNHVLTERQYRVALRPGLSSEERMKHFNARQDWLRDFPVFEGFLARARVFISGWSKVGIIAPCEPPAESGLPSPTRVETQNGFDP